MSAKIKIMRVLVFGGAGFIGSNFIRHIFNKHRDALILNYDKLTYSGNLENLKGVEGSKSYRFVKGDVADAKKIKEIFIKFRPHYVINFAGETHVDRSIHIGAKEFIDTNVTGTFNILEAVKGNKDIKNYVQVSTDEVFGSLPLKSPRKFREKTAFAPNAPYAATKAGGDVLCRAYNHTFKVPVMVTHCSNNYGPYQYPEKLIPFLILRLLEDKTLPIYGDGKNVRDWIYVLDHCEALRLCLFKGRPGEVYNIGADNELSNLEIAGLILRYFKKSENCVEFVKDRPGHDRRYAVDSSKIKRELGWRLKYKFETTFHETIRWYLNNQKWIANVKRKTGVFNPHIEL